MNIRNPIAYEVRINKSWDIDLTLTNKNEGRLCRYSHCVKPKEAAEFAERLEQVLADAHYTELDSCPLCGKAFTRQNRLTLLEDGRVIHSKCVMPAVRRGELTYEDCKDFWFHYFPKELPYFDYSNLSSEAQSPIFRYAIQVVSRKTIHLYMIEPHHFMKRHSCLTYDECLGLIQEIRAKLANLGKMPVGACQCCGSLVYEDTPYRKLEDRWIIHEGCMNQYAQKVSKKIESLRAHLSNLKQIPVYQPRKSFCSFVAECRKPCGTNGTADAETNRENENS